MDDQSPVTETPAPEDLSLEERFERFAGQEGHEDDEAPPAEEGAEPAGETPPKDAAQIEIDPEAPLFEIELAGQDGKTEAKKLSLSELQNGYVEREALRAQNETLQRSAADVQTKVHEAVAPVEQHYRQNLEIMQKAVWNLASRELANVDFSRLAAEDPAEAVRLSARAQEIQGVLQAAQEEIAKVQQQEQQRAQAVTRAQAQKSVEALKRDIPGWGQELYTTVLKTGMDAYGFSPEEVNAVVDHRMIKVLHDAHKYRQLQAAKPGITKKVVAVPKMIRASRSEPEQKRGPELEKLRAQFKRTGDMRLGAKYLEKFL
jgi:hypothetical protein